MSYASHEPCRVCKAPCHSGYELHSHELACLVLAVGDRPGDSHVHPGQLAYEDRLKAFQRNAMAGHPAWSPDTVRPGGTEPIPDHLARAQIRQGVVEEHGITGLRKLIEDTAKDHAEDVTKSWYAQHETRAAVPDGRAQCASCNGLTLMYPQCHACSGKGWV